MASPIAITPAAVTPSTYRASAQERSSAQWLALRLRAGEPAAVAGLYERYSGLVYAIADELLGVGASAVDVVRVVQGVFARCCREVTADRCAADQMTPWLMALTERDVRRRARK